MQIDLRVLDHLGIRLYSNAAAVLSEAVANAWDADSRLVEIEILPERIAVVDNGTGMDLDAINSRFLNVGYDKRNTEGSTSHRGRAFMGRKSIGKLSLFSIAEEVSVHTVKADGVQHAFRMKTKAIESAIQRHVEYRPEPIAFDGGNSAHGTRIVLTSLKRQRAGQTAAALRKRIARRFSIIGYNGLDDDRFVVCVNGEEIGSQDRDDLRKVEFLWEFGQKTIAEADCPSLVHREVIPQNVSSTWKVSGWLAAAKRPTDLRNEESGTMNGIVVIARGRLIQENILDKLGFNRILNSYITGQVEADFLDVQTESDIATSDRQRIIEDDDRYVALVAFLRRSLVDISDEWSRLRNETRGREVQQAIPSLGKWIDTLPQGQHAPARALLGMIGAVELDQEDDRRGLYRAGVLAFERLRLREESHRLGELHHLDAAQLLPLIIDLSALEGTMYRDIVRERLAVINRFTGLVDLNEKEKVLAQCIFEQMWLLDPGWERATGSERIEQGLRKKFGEFAENLTPEQSKGRVDIRYRTNANQHIIVELKRAERVLKSTELAEQGQRYQEALSTVLQKTFGDDYQPNITLVFILGKPVSEYSRPDFVRLQMRSVQGRIVYYDELIHAARASYGEYLEQTKKSDAIEQLLSLL